MGAKAAAEVVTLGYLMVRLLLIGGYSEAILLLLRLSLSFGYGGIGMGQG